MEAIDWKKLIKIDRSWHTDVLNHQFSLVDGKVRISMHSVNSVGTQVRSDLLVTKLSRLIPHYVLGDKRTKALESPMDIAHQSIKYFGNIDPEKDGKYGELGKFITEVSKATVTIQGVIVPLNNVAAITPYTQLFELHKKKIEDTLSEVGYIDK